jgi:MFS family permease
MIGGYSAVLHAGLACGPFVGILSRLLWPEKGVFAVFGLLCLLGGAILAGTLKADRPLSMTAVVQPSRRNRMAILAADRRIVGVLPAVALYGAGYGACLTIIPVFLEVVKGFGEISLGVYFAGFYTAIGLTAIVTGVLSDRFDRRGFMIVGLTLGGFGTAILPALERSALAVVLAAAVLALGIFGLSAFGYLNDRAPADFKGALSGLFFLSWGSGMFAGPLLIGWMDAAAGAGAGLQCYGVAAGLYGMLFANTLSATRPSRKA